MALMAEDLTIASEAATPHTQRTSIMRPQEIFERADLGPGLARDLLPLHRTLGPMDHPKGSAEGRGAQVVSTGSVAAIPRKVLEEQVGAEVDPVVAGMRPRASVAERASAAGTPAAGDIQAATEVAPNTTAR